MHREDLTMDGDVVMASTEVNGDHESDTIDPAMISINPDHQAQLHSLEKPPISGPGPTDFYMADASLSATHYAQAADFSPPDDESDDMDFTDAQVKVRIPPGPRFPPLPYSSTKTGLVYDARMRFHCEPLGSLIRADDIHPEDPRRIFEIFQEIQSAGLVQSSDEDGEERDEQCWRIQPKEASRAQICLVHTRDHYEFIKSLRGKA
jgi:histone deacetylase 6